MAMRRVLAFAVAATGMFLATRKIAEGAGADMRERCSTMCDRFLAGMPKSFPPNRIMADLDAIKDQNARILEVLEKRLAASEPRRGPHVRRGPKKTPRR